MKYTPPGRLKTIDAFREAITTIDPAFSCTDDPLGPTSPLATPIQTMGRTLANRFAVHPMEGWDGTVDGLPTELTRRRWRRFGSSGAALIWGGEAFAVQSDGRANPNQLFLNPDADTEGGLATLLEDLKTGARESGGDPDAMLVGLQLTHSGRWSRPLGPLAAMIPQRNPWLGRKYELGDDHPVLTDDDLKGIRDAFIAAAVIARRVGFDFVDIKCAHGYLLHELLGAKQRPGPYGGSFENRTRLLTEIARGIAQSCSDLHLGTRVSMIDFTPFEKTSESSVGRPMGDPADMSSWTFGIHGPEDAGIAMDEATDILALLPDLGISIVNLTLGSPYYSPHAQRPAAYPPSDGYLPPEDPMRGVWRHLQLARACKAAAPDLQFVGSGYTYLQEYLPHVAAHEVGEGHVDFVGLGRMMLSYPRLPHDVLTGQVLDRKHLCRTFSDCTTAPRNGMVSGCYPLDPLYKDREEAVQVRVLRKDSSNGTTVS